MKVNLEINKTELLMNQDKRKTIVLIDDSSTNNFLHKSILTEEGYNVVTFSSAAMALTKLSTIIPDLIIVDLLMPGMDGFRFMERKNLIKALTQVPVVVLTSKLSSESEHKAYTLGATAYLVKPLSISDFKDKINMVMQKQNLLKV